MSSRKRPSAPTLTHRVDQYALDVLAGRVIAGPFVRLACERHLRDRDRHIFTFNEAEATQFIDFCETVLRLPDTKDPYGDPKPFLLMGWEAFIGSSAFGWQDDHAGARRYRDLYVEVGKGGGKTMFAAAFALYCLVMDQENSAEIYSVACTLEQSRICWRDAEGMVQASPALQQLLQLNVANISHPATRSFFRPVSSEHRGLDGKRPHFAVIDELHEHPDGRVTNKIRAGAKGRRQPLFLEITNSGFDQASVCWEHHEKSRKVLQGLIRDDRWFAYVCALDEGDDPLSDKTCWPKANPGLGVTIREDYLEQQVRNAKDLPGEMNMVLRLNFCVWTRSVAQFIPAGKWSACRGEIDPSVLRAAPCYGGLDLGETDDFSAWALVWRLPDDRVYVRVRCFVPRAATEARAARPYQQWVQAGTLEITDGNISDFDRIERVVRDDCRALGVRQVGYDKRFSEQLAQHLIGEGITMVDTVQGFYFNEALRWLSTLVAEKQIVHDGDPLLAWMIDNAVTLTGRDRQIRLAKEKATDKIDGVAALTMALDRAMRGPQQPASPYLLRGVRTLGQSEAESLAEWS